MKRCWTPSGLKRFDMVKLIVIGLFVLVAVVLAVWSLILNAKCEMLRKQKRTLDGYDVLVHEKVCELNRQIERYDGAVDINASYTVTESDELKYTAEKYVRKVAIQSISKTIASDIVRSIAPTVDVVDGHRRYSYRLKVWQHGQPSSQTTSANDLAESPAK